MCQEMTINQIEELLTNIYFHNFLKWRIEQYYFALAFFANFILIFVSIILMVS